MGLDPIASPPDKSASTSSEAQKSEDEKKADGAILELVRALGLRRPEKGTLSAVRAVLTQMVWPSRLTDEAAWRATGASRTNFMKYKRRILTVAMKEGWSLEGYNLPRGFLNDAEKYHAEGLVQLSRAAIYRRPSRAKRKVEEVCISPGGEAPASAPNPKEPEGPSVSPTTVEL